MLPPGKAQPRSGRSQGKLIFDPKLNADECEDTKTVGIKMVPRLGMRQLIDYALTKVRNDWKLTIHGVGMDIAKVLKAVEIIKTRLPFLHQHSEFIEEMLSAKRSKADDDKNDDSEEKQEEGRLRSGIKITVSRQPFDIPDKVGY